MNGAAKGAIGRAVMTFPKFVAPAAQLAFVALAAVGTFGFVRTAQDGERRRRCAPICLSRPTYAAADRLAPDFELPSAAGERVALSQFRGKVVFLNFWSMTCGPCMKEMPDLAELAKSLGDRRDIVLLTVSVDEEKDEALAALEAALGEKPPFPVLFDPERRVVDGLFGTRKYPETWLIDPRGVIRARYDGARDWSSGAMSELLGQLAAGSYCPVIFSAGRELTNHLCGAPKR